MKKVFAPHLNRHIVLGGRRRPKADPNRRRIALADYLDLAVLPPPPSAVDYRTAGLRALRNIYLNDKYGCCVIADGYHFLGTVTGNATIAADSIPQPFVATDDQIIADYSAIGGFDPNNPEATDNGCDEDTAEDYWVQHGFASGDKLLGSVDVDASNTNLVKAGIWLFEGAAVCAELPDAWIGPFPSADGFVWDAGTPDDSNGHCFEACGYTEAGDALIDTWALFGTITKAALAANAVRRTHGSFTIRLTAAAINKATGKAPNGFALADLQSDLAKVKRRIF